MKKNLLMRFRSVRTSIVVSFGVLVVFALLTYFIISLQYTEDTVLDNSTEYTSQLIGQVNNDIDSYISYMENISFIVTHNSDVRDYLFTENLTPERSEELQERIVTLFQTVSSTREDITNIALLPDRRSPMINDGRDTLNPYTETEELEWYQEALDAGGQAAISTSHVQNAISGKYDWVVTLSRSITNNASPGVHGVFFVDLNYNAISDLCERISLGDKGYIYILDKDGGIVYHPQQQLIQVDGFGHIIVNPRLEPFLLGGKIIPRRHEQNGDLLILFPYGLRERKAVYTGHHDIGNDHVKQSTAVHRVIGLVGVPASGGLISVLSQEIADSAIQLFIVLHN